MRAIAEIEDLQTPECKNTIVRNLSRIMDIRILDIDLEQRTLSLVYDSIAAFEKAKKELWRIGHPISHCRYQGPDRKERTFEYNEQLLSL